jgi:hypothetical protein
MALAQINQNMQINFQTNVKCRRLREDLSDVIYRRALLLSDDKISESHVSAPRNSELHVHSLLPDPVSAPLTEFSTVTINKTGELGVCTKCLLVFLAVCDRVGTHSCKIQPTVNKGVIVLTQTTTAEGRIQL